MVEFQGSLFSNDFLNESITRLPDWAAVNSGDMETLHRKLNKIFDSFPTDKTPNEAQTEDDLIWKVLSALGWTVFLRQQNLAPKGRDDVPDGLLFEDDAAKTQANKTPKEWRRYEFGLAIVESKRWNRPLDRRSGQQGEDTAPSTQMLRYLRRVEDLTTGKLRWGILTNGGKWRLYYSGARSVAEQFFEIDLAHVLGIEGHKGGLFALDDKQRAHALRVFYLIFGRRAFIGTVSDPRTFHQRALEEPDRGLVQRQELPHLERHASGGRDLGPLRTGRRHRARATKGGSAGDDRRFRGARQHAGRRPRLLHRSPRVRPLPVGLDHRGRAATDRGSRSRRRGAPGRDRAGRARLACG